MTALTAATAFGTGAVSGLGPCVAARVTAVAGLLGNRRGRDRFAGVAAFVIGLCAGYAALGAVAGALNRAGRYASLTYGVLAIALIAYGGVALLRTQRRCRHEPDSRFASPAAALLAGAAFSGIGTPCCGPLAAAAASAGAATGHNGALIVFFLGHAAVLAAIALPFQSLRDYMGRFVPAAALNAIGGGVTLGLGAYYALLV